VPIYFCIGFSFLPDSGDKNKSLTGSWVCELNKKIENVETSFQDGCNTIVAGCTAYGKTPSSNSPTNIVTAIETIYNDRYNSGYWAGHGVGYNSGYSAGQDVDKTVTFGVNIVNTSNGLLGRWFIAKSRFKTAYVTISGGDVSTFSYSLDGAKAWYTSTGGYIYASSCTDTLFLACPDNGDDRWVGLQVTLTME